MDLFNEVLTFEQARSYTHSRILSQFRNKNKTAIYYSGIKRALYVSTIFDKNITLLKAIEDDLINKGVLILFNKRISWSYNYYRVYREIFQQEFNYEDNDRTSSIL